MEMYRVSFASIRLLEVNLAEITVDEGVDIDLKMVEEIHLALHSLLPDKFSLFINKKNSYSTQLDALIKFGQLKGIDKIAVYAPNKMAQLSADFSASIPSSSVLNIQVFTDPNIALAWLKQSQ